MKLNIVLDMRYQKHKHLKDPKMLLAPIILDQTFYFLGEMAFQYISKQLLIEFSFQLR